MKREEEERKMSKQVKAVINHNFKHPWVIVDQNTGEILDDAQGYGYRTAQKAHAAWSYKHRSDKSVRNHKLAQKWWRKHKEFARDLDEEAFEIAKGSWGPDDKFDLPNSSQSPCLVILLVTKSSTPAAPKCRD